MMNKAFSLKFNYKCSPLCRWVYFSFLSVSFFYFFFFCSLSLCMSPVTHYASPCHEFKIPGMTAWDREKRGGGPATPNTHLIFYTTKWLLFAEKRDREKNNKGLQLSALSDSGSPAPRYFHELKLEVLFLCGVTHLGPENERTACQPPLHHLRWPPSSHPQPLPLSCGLVSQQPLYYVTAHYHVPTS